MPILHRHVTPDIPALAAGNGKIVFNAGGISHRSPIVVTAALGGTLGLDATALERDGSHWDPLPSIPSTFSLASLSWSYRIGCLHGYWNGDYTWDPTCYGPDYMVHEFYYPDENSLDAYFWWNHYYYHYQDGTINGSDRLETRSAAVSTGEASLAADLVVSAHCHLGLVSDPGENAYFWVAHLFEGSDASDTVEVVKLTVRSARPDAYGHYVILGDIQNTQVAVYESDRFPTALAALRLGHGVRLHHAGAAFDPGYDLGIDLSGTYIDVSSVAA